MSKKRIIGIPVLTTIMMYAIFVNVAAAPAATTIYIDPPKSSVAPMETFSVNINVADVTGLSSWEVKLKFDPGFLKVVGAFEGHFLSDVGLTYFVSSPDVNYIIVGCLLLEPVTASGSGTLATIQFLVEGEGKCVLAVYDTILLDIDLVEILHSVEDGYFSNVMVADLVRRSAWPEHHHFVVSKDEDGIQTLHSKVKNLGEGYGFIRVNFTVWKLDGTPVSITAKYTVDGIETKIAPGEIVPISIGLWESRETAWEPGKYSVSGTCLYSITGDTWKMGEKVKAFGFAVVP